MRRNRDSARNYRQLEADKMIETVTELRARIEKRFPGAGLGKLVDDLLHVAEETVATTEWINRPHLGLRALAGVLTLAIAALLYGLFSQIRHFSFNDYTNSIQALDASISSVAFIGAAVIFLMTWENRLKRKRALQKVHELRALAHIVDMHQLTKDPESYFGEARHTSSRKKREMTPFELNRYLDYCSDTLALIGKIAALYVQAFQDPILLDAVDDVEDLTSGFARKIWQKITLLEGLRRPPPH